MTRAASVIVAMCAAMLGSFSCGGQEVIIGCQDDTDCGASQTCNVATGVCLCADDAACDASEFCNLAGRCQTKTECLNNADCGAFPEICDTSRTDENAGQCIALNAQSTQCVLDSHCPFGFYCQDRICQLGCRENGDCPLGQPCLAGQCASQDGACNGPGYCAFGEICDDVSFTCRPHREEASLCLHCENTQCFRDSDCKDGAPCVEFPDDPTLKVCQYCSSADQPCLIDNSVAATACTADAQCPQGFCVKQQCLYDDDCPGNLTCEGEDTSILHPVIGTCSSGHCGDSYCGSSACSLEDNSDPCPRGYSCFSLLTVSNTPCSRGAGDCTAPRSCSADRPGELTQTGYCSCLSSDECPDNLTCVNPGPNGACISGTTCAPSSGLLCEDVR